MSSEFRKPSYNAIRCGSPVRIAALHPLRKFKLTRYRHPAPTAIAANSASIAAPSPAKRAAVSRSVRRRVICHSRRSSAAWFAVAARAAAACWRACLRRLYQAEREIPSASHGFCAGFLGPIPCARRQRSERRRACSRRCSSVCFMRCLPYRDLVPIPLKGLERRAGQGEVRLPFKIPFGFQRHRSPPHLYVK